MGAVSNYTRPSLVRRAWERGRSSHKITDFVVTPSGIAIPIPQGWIGRVADNGRGLVYQRSGATGNADTIRIMDAVARYPQGYIRYYNWHGQPLNPLGAPGDRASTHIPLDFEGAIPGWPK